MTFHVFSSVLRCVPFFPPLFHLCSIGFPSVFNSFHRFPSTDLRLSFTDTCEVSTPLGALARPRGRHVGDRPTDGQAKGLSSPARERPGVQRRPHLGALPASGSRQKVGRIKERLAAIPP